SVAFACRQGPSQAEARSIVITLERTRCYGSCPAYSVTLRGDGSVEYAGEVGVDVPGRQAGSIDPSRVIELAESAESIGFFAMESSYFEDCTDLPTTTISIRTRTKNKRVSNYYGGCDRKTTGPQVELAALAGRIDTAADTRRWVAPDDTSLAGSIRAGLDVNS